MPTSMNITKNFLWKQIFKAGRDFYPEALCLLSCPFFPHHSTRLLKYLSLLFQLKNSFSRFWNHFFRLLDGSYLRHIATVRSPKVETSGNRNIWSKVLKLASKIHSTACWTEANAQRLIKYKFDNRMRKNK